MGNLDKSMFGFCSFKTSNNLWPTFSCVEVWLCVYVSSRQPAVDDDLLTQELLHTACLKLIRREEFFSSSYWRPASQAGVLNWVLSINSRHCSSLPSPWCCLKLFPPQEVAGNLYKVNLEYTILFTGTTWTLLKYQIESQKMSFMQPAMCKLK